jgi:hypothetical protein
LVDAGCAEDDDVSGPIAWFRAPSGRVVRYHADVAASFECREPHVVDIFDLSLAA